MAHSNNDMSSEDKVDESIASSVHSAPHPEKDTTLSSPPADEDEFPTDWRKIMLIMTALYMSMFLVALDRTIIGTAIPTITDEFHSVDDVGWYAAAYLITSCAVQLIFGRVYSFYNVKWVMLSAIFIFEVGSTLCGAAPNSTAFIIGRAIAGIGAAGIFSGAVNLMVVTIPLNKRPLYQGIFGAIFGISSIIGPLLGGVFTTHATWRWCFYLNLPIGAVVVLIILVILHPPANKDKHTTKERITQLDPFGTAVFLPGIVCLLLALQWGGATYAWSNARIIVLFILSFILLLIFAYIQVRVGENATLPLRILKNRSILSAIYFSFISPGAMFVMIYFLPLWFQAIKKVSAVQSGIDTLPMVLALVVASIIAGIMTQKIGYYVPQLIACSVIMTIGAGLITTFEVDTGSAKWIGYQVLFGFGLGLGMQQAGMAAQACLSRKDVTLGVALMFFTQGLGGAIWISIAQVVFNNSLMKNLSGVEGLDPGFIVKMGATELASGVPEELLPMVLKGYNLALRDTFRVALGCAVATILAGLTMEWKSIKGLKQGGGGGEQQPKSDEEKDVENVTDGKKHTEEQKV